MKKLNFKAFSRKDKSIICKKSRRSINPKTDLNLSPRLISVNRNRSIGLQNVLPRELSAVSLTLFYSNVAMRKTA